MKKEYIMKQSLFMDFIGDIYFIAVFEFLMENKDKSFNKSEMFRGAGICKRAFYDRWSKLLDYRIVLPDDEINKKYRINTYSPIVRAMIVLKEKIILFNKKPYPAERCSEKIQRNYKPRDTP